MAMSMFCAAAATTFNDYYTVTYEGKTVEDGGYVYSEEFLEEAYYMCDVMVTMITNEPVESRSLHILGTYTDLPTKQMSEDNPLLWGAPSMCYSPVGGIGGCPLVPDDAPANAYADFTLGGGNITISNSAPVELQFHNMFVEPDYLPYENAGIYKVEIEGTINGYSIGSFTYYMVVGPNAAHVDGVVADDNAPSVYFDLSGRRVINPAKGQLVIERKGDKAIKRIF